MKYYTIGEFSDLTKLSLKALRIYDKKGILKPSYTDPDTSYRYYNNLNLIDSNIIKDLKFFGCSLDEIQKYLTQRNRFLLDNLYRKKLTEIENEISHLENISQAIKIRMLSSVTGEPDEIILKNIEERKIIFTRYQSPCNPESFAKRFFELSEILRQNRITGSRFFALFHDHHENFNYSSADIEVAAEIDKAIPDNRFFRIIGEQLYLTLVVKGPYCDLTAGYINIMDYAERYHLEKDGPAIEIYYTDFTNETTTENFITELQVPVKKL